MDKPTRVRTFINAAIHPEHTAFNTAIAMLEGGERSFGTESIEVLTSVRAIATGRVCDWQECLERAIAYHESNHRLKPAIALYGRCTVWDACQILKACREKGVRCQIWRSLTPDRVAEARQAGRSLRASYSI